MPRKRMSGADRKEAIIKAARPLFARNGFNGTSIRSIAKAAGVSEGLLYKHFLTKDALYKEIARYVLDLASIFNPEMSKLKPGTDTLVKYAYRTIRVILFEVPGLKEAQYWHERLLYRSLIGDNRYARVHFKNLKNSILAPFQKCIEASIRDGDMIADDIEPSNKYWFLHHLAMSMNLCYLSDDPSTRKAWVYEGPKEELARQILLFLLRGMGMTQEAISRYAKLDRLEAFFLSLFSGKK
jgi:AcrR family transcriptional regulator